MADVAVLARREGHEIVSLVAYVVPSEPRDASLGEDLKKQLAMKLLPHVRPDLRLIGAIPKLPGLKVDIGALESLEQKHCERIEATAPGRDFYRLLLAARLVSLAKRDGSVDAPQVVHTPSVEELAKLVVGQKPGARRGPRVIPLQEGNTGTPIYFINAGLDEFNLARLMGDDRPVFGIESPWPLAWRQAATEGRASAMPTMEQLVAPYFAALSAHANHSPCVLAGHSMAGQIAFEMAHQLERLGGRVEMVMLFDTWLIRPSVYRAALCRLRQIWRRAPNRLPAPGTLKSIRRRLKDSSLAVRWMLGRQEWWLWTRRRMSRALNSKTAGGLTTLPDEMGMPIEMELFERLNENARKSHRPRCLDSRGVLFRASDPYSEFYHAVDGSKGWMGLFRRGLDIIPVTGDHLSMVRDERHRPALAKAVERVLTQVKASAQ